MSYVQDAHVSISPVAVVEGRSNVLSARAALSLILLLAFLHGALYALFLPPWGLIDEAQHFHYIEYIAKEQSLPVAGTLYLSDDIIDSLFATRRWQTFQWTPPPAPDPKLMGLEGYSYEAYQPPLFYLAMAPFYLALPQDILVKVYGLRLIVVLLSLITVWALYRTAGLLLPQYPQISFWAGLVLVAIPERAFATSRINNDALLEVLAALFFLVLTRSAMVGLNGRRAFLLGLLVGLAAWAKVSGGFLVLPLLMLLWALRRSPQFWQKAAWSLVVVPMGIALALRNLLSYGDLTGFEAFEQLQRLAPVDTSFDGVVRTLVSLPNHLWVVWWKGSNVGSNWLLTLFYMLMAAAVVAAWVRLFPHLRQRQKGRQVSRRWLAIIYVTTVLVYAAAVIQSYYQGMIPVVQGRLLLPAIVPFVLLLVWGLWLYPWHEQMMLALVVILWGVGIFALFGNLISYFYYWSDVVAGVMRATPVNAWQWLNLIYQRVLFDKPAFFAPLLWTLPLCYGAALLSTFIVLLREVTSPPRYVGGGDHPRHP